MKSKKPLAYGFLAGIALFAFYMSVISIFQGFQFAILNFKNVWFFILPLVFGFGTQIGLYTSIKHTAEMTGTVALSGGLSGGSMIACCSHFLLNIIPVIGFSGLALFLMKYQTMFFAIGIVANVFGVTYMLSHKEHMKHMKKMSQINGGRK
ncbi:hypothetical protein COU59_03395 [Candidatus Pacearchaeota archaeon CG10_big_fil_rev_8_21_14_0_10_34_12]|nr:MAG: hypothetical protein COU59_03395 [Candidatus Pacearchaeota archaeon CG10_big_fil_rev_8_21_14_0_10_34_12]